MLEASEFNSYLSELTFEASELNSDPPSLNPGASDLNFYDFELHCETSEFNSEPLDLNLSGC